MYQPDDSLSRGERWFLFLVFTLWFLYDPLGMIECALLFIGMVVACGVAALVEYVVGRIVKAVMWLWRLIRSYISEL